MEKGIETEENNLYKQTDEVAKNVLDSLNEIDSGAGTKKNYLNSGMNTNLDYNKLFDILYKAFTKALSSCKLTLDDEGFARIVKNELYEVL